jgi:hypothetical protein
MREISVFFFCATLLATLGIAGHLYNEQVDAAAKFVDPVEVQGTYVKASCVFSTAGKTYQHNMHITYRYRPSGAPSFLSYEAKDYRGFDSLDQCKAALQVIEAERSEAKFWYERNEPWKFKLHLTSKKSSFLLWLFLPIAALMLGVGILDQKKINRRKR